MTEYHDYGVKLSGGQVKKIFNAHKNGTGTTINLSINNLQGAHKLPLTQTQINKIRRAKSGVKLHLSKPN